MITITFENKLIIPITIPKDEHTDNLAKIQIIQLTQLK